MTGQLPELYEGEKDPEVSGYMPFFIDAFNDLVGSLGETGFFPFSEVGNWLDEHGIKDYENRQTARYLLTQICAGRNEAVNEELEEARRKSG